MQLQTCSVRISLIRINSPKRWTTNGLHLTRGRNRRITLNSNELQRVGPQLVADTRIKAGKRPARVKARHCTKNFRRMQVDNLRAHQSSDDAAQALREPGVTGRTVIDSTLLYLLDQMDRIERFLQDSLAARRIAA